MVFFYQKGTSKKFKIFIYDRLILKVTKKYFQFPTLTHFFIFWFFSDKKNTQQYIPTKFSTKWVENLNNDNKKLMSNPQVKLKF